MVKNLTDFIFKTTSKEIPEPVMHMARRCLVDLLAVWASGMSTKPSLIARNHAVKRYSSTHGALPMPFDGRKTSPPGFAFAGAATIDAIDGHDGHQACKGHAGVALLPALFAELGTIQPCSLNELLTHLIIGYEVAIRAGLSLHSSVADYHSSGAWNALGCTALASRLRKLTPDQFRHAIGIAEYYGPRAQMMRCIEHPTMVKDSSSWGAMVGISAADLAEDGFTGAPAITCEADEVAHFWGDFGENWRILETNFKIYPVCRWAQPPIEALLALQKAEPVSPEDIKEIRVTTFHEATCLSSCRPKDSDEAQYSLPISVALALKYGHLTPDLLDPECFNQPEIHALADKVTFGESAQYNDAFPEERFADVMLITTDGRKICSAPAVARGNFDSPLTDADISDKFHMYSETLISTENRDIIASILTQPTQNINSKELVSMLLPAKSSL